MNKSENKLVEKEKERERILEKLYPLI